MDSKHQKPWGFEGTVVSTDLYSARIIIVLAGERTSYIYQKSRDKTLFILQGVVQLTVEGTTRLLQEGERYHVRPGIMHRIHAVKGDSTVLEVGTKFEEEDVMVVEDDYSTK
jgi:mannose-6-phosphate isomerase-like protein (cupin superfamily)